MTYTVTVASPDGRNDIYICGGANDQAAPIYAGKVVELLAKHAQPDASVIVLRDDEEIGVPATVREMRTRAPLISF